MKLQSGDEENLCLWREMHAALAGAVRRDLRSARRELRRDAWGELLQSAAQGGRRRSFARAASRVRAKERSAFSPTAAQSPKKIRFSSRTRTGWRPNPALVQKSDGAANYTTTDLATLAYRLATWSPDEIVYVTDGRQQLHFRQLFAIFRRWHPELAPVRLAHVWFGSILGDDGKPFKTRSGETVKLAELLDEAEERALEARRRKESRVAGSRAPRDRADRRNRRGEVCRPAAESAKRLRLLVGPNAQLPGQHRAVSAIQPTCAFARSFARRGRGFQISDFGFQISEPAEIALAKKLLQFGEVLPQVLDDYRPNVLANYLYELAIAFHSFFEACPVLKAETRTRESRLLLCETTARVLQQGLALLGIEVPERM